VKVAGSTGLRTATRTSPKKAALGEPRPRNINEIGEKAHSSRVQNSSRIGTRRSSDTKRREKLRECACEKQAHKSRNDSGVSHFEGTCTRRVRSTGKCGHAQRGSVGDKKIRNANKPLRY
jgi:hypothetical protein